MNIIINHLSKIRIRANTNANPNANQNVNRVMIPNVNPYMNQNSDGIKTKNKAAWTRNEMLYNKWKRMPKQRPHTNGRKRNAIHKRTQIQIEIRTRNRMRIRAGPNLNTNANPNVNRIQIPNANPYINLNGKESKTNKKNMKAHHIGTRRNQRALEGTSGNKKE